MTGGKKRSADEADVATRGDGAKRRESEESGKDTKRGPKAIPASAFKRGAVPLHVTVTDTPSTGGNDDNNASEAPVDPRFLGAVALQPCTFTTGSYGWKGSKRLAVDIIDPKSGETKKVQVIVNATVMGSKQTAKEAGVEAVVDTSISDGNGIEDGGTVDAAEQTL
ncbi:hypothetical protein BC826DRAFT_1105068 [Russula brevipes]|nr:hypothetical protein BC826DRAFT_1105068 [Russula brevipes]